MLNMIISYAETNITKNKAAIHLLAEEDII
jgi:hypothetical protein